MKIVNRDAREWVVKKLPFQGSNLFAQWNDEDEMYVVYSYGTHWPLFIWFNGIWFENEDRRSVTTSKHRTQTHPHCPTVMLPTEWMKRLAQGGYRKLVKARVAA